jgi:predicted phage-related endonuclease
MTNPIKRIRKNIADIKSCFWIFLNTIDMNTKAVQALAVEQKELRSKFDELVDHSRFQVRVKKQELTRAGHAH